MNPLLKETIGLVRDRSQLSSDPKEEKVVVNESLSKAATYYEILRNALDWQEEHLFLKNAIKRILKRRYFFKVSKDHTASALMRELVWARYFENETLPVRYIDDAASTLRKYDFVRSHTHSKSSSTHVSDVYISLIACEIEENLKSHEGEEKFLEFAKQVILKNIKIDKSEISGEVIDIEVEIYLRKIILKSDFEQIRYRLMKRYFAKFPTLNRKEAKEIGEQFDNIFNSIDLAIMRNKGSKIFKYVKKNSPPLLIIWGLLNRSPKEFNSLMLSQDMFRQSALGLISEKNRSIFKRVNRTLFRGIIFIFFTKVFLAFLIELPYESAYLDNVNYLALTINTALPPIIMIVTRFFIKIPGEKNTKELIELSESVAFKDTLPTDPLETLQVRKGRGYVLFNIAYTVLSLAIIGLVVWGLIGLNFNIVSIGLFFIFVSIVSFLAFRIKAIAKELEVKGRDDTVVSGLYNFILLPFIIIGKALSDKWSDYNVTLWFWDFIVEAPFKVVMGIFESWISFVREKREDFE